MNDSTDEKRLYFHVGAGKTGTSAIQWSLKRNRSELQRRGVCVPTIGEIPKLKGTAHHLLTGAPQFPDADPRKLWREISQLEEKAVVISTEFAHTQASYAKGKILFREVSDLLNATGWEVRIVFYIRAQDQWIQSAYEQWLKTGALRSAETISDVIERYSSGLVEQVDTFADIFGKQSLIVRPYETSQLFGESSVTDFLNVLGVEVDDRIELPNADKNPGMPRPAINIKRLFNHVCETQEQARLINATIFEYARIKSADAGDQKGRHRSLIPATKRTELHRLLQDDYARIAREYLRREDGVLFESLMYSEESPDHREDREFVMSEGEMELILFVFRRLLERMSSCEDRLDAIEAKMGC